MNNKVFDLALELVKNHSLTLSQYEYLIDNRDEQITKYLREEAVNLRKSIYGNDIYIRGLIEISNICKNDCYYCGIRRSNKNCDRYRLTPDEILQCADEGYNSGFRTIVMQGGEDAYFTDEVLCDIISEIKNRYPDCAITLSLGERSFESYKKLKESGADRYLLRHETADNDHYGLLHPDNLSLDVRMQCLRDLRKAGFAVGCGFMVGSPHQTTSTLAKDLKFIEEFKPEMCGIGPFIPHKDTCFKDEPAGTVELTCFLLSIVRIIHPPLLLPSTTALGSIDPTGREKGILSGANVVMPNLSPQSVRKKYMLYDNKLSSGAEAAEYIKILSDQMNSIGYKVVTARGDFKDTKEENKNGCL